MGNGEELASGQLDWAIGRLTLFIEASNKVHVPAPASVISAGSYRTKSPDDEVVRQWAVIERILTRYLPNWQTQVQAGDKYSRPGYRWREQREAALLCLSALQAEAEIQEYLVDRGPALMAAGMHPWVWEAARLAWTAGNYDDAIDAAAWNVNSRLRAKVGRRDIGEGDLVANVSARNPATSRTLACGLNFPKSLARGRWHPSTLESLHSARDYSRPCAIRLHTRRQE